MKFLATIVQINHYQVSVEADNRKIASKKALELFQQDMDQFESLDETFDILDVEEIEE